MFQVAHTSDNELDTSNFILKPVSSQNHVILPFVDISDRFIMLFLWIPVEEQEERTKLTI